jgi:hypothetical protein
MKHAWLPALVLLTLGNVVQAADNRFDGTWDTVVSCENAAGALGYSFKFPSPVKDGVLHGEKGTKGKPGWLQLDGKIQPDGVANIYADGLVGTADAAVGHRPSGTQYDYCPELEVRHIVGWAFLPAADLSGRPHT